ncbi:MAG: DNA gyrase/topoisomerase IV subunit A [Marinifilaceae bacterium]|jgi:topoisomerase-4 subunit A|nr:DNA gyrase/topoisomerase IV subunit A [Marinifilaceae bacterium]
MSDIEEIEIEDFDESVEEVDICESEGSDLEEMDSEENNDNKELRNITRLSGLYKGWFMDYASYVILERAVPYVNDGLKPVQRRILHSMKLLDDGRYNKVANIIGNTMQFHPHGDASIGNALVALGQKDLLIDCQGNWGNILTGDSAAAPRYIEARLSKFALEVLFNSKTTDWQNSYDGRNKEPISLPVKFPLLLAQGVEGIAVGLASKILPHNFNELLDACIAYLQNKEFELFPDFATGGMIDVSRYNDGLRGGNVKLRAKIEKVDSKTLKISEIPFTRTTGSLIDSIIKANDKGKIKIKRVDDNTAAEVEILVHLAPGVSSDKTIDALYAFTDCELSISPNACVIRDEKPCFITVSDILKDSANKTVYLLKKELEIRLRELLDEWHNVSLERIFIENRMYKEKSFEQSKSVKEVVSFLRVCFEPYINDLKRDISDDDLKHLLEIKMRRILKYNVDKANEYILGLEEEMKKVKHNIENIIPYSIKYFRGIKRKYGKGRERKTEIRSFDNIVAAKVVVKNEKLYINKADGFIGTALKKDEYICDCSDIDDVIIFYRDGKYKITKVADKLFIGKNIIYVNIFRKNDKRTIYNVAYRDGRKGFSYVKRFNVTSLTRDKEYDLTKGTVGSRVHYFSVNPNGEAEVIKVSLKPKPEIKKTCFEYDFADLAIRGKATLGNLLTKFEVHKVVLKAKGVSTLGGRKIWFDKDILRLNNMGNGDFLGEFLGEDKVLVITKDAKFYTTSFEFTNHYEDNILLIEKLDREKIWSAVFYNADKKSLYLKRFKFEESTNVVSLVGENEKSYLISLSDKENIAFRLSFTGKPKERLPETVYASDFIGVKSVKARGKRLSTYEITKVEKIIIENNEDENFE